MAGDNAARRLHDLLEQLRQQSPGAPLLTSWATVTGIPESDLGELFAALAAFVALPDQVEVELKNKVPASGLGLYLQWQPQVNATVGAFRSPGDPTQVAQQHYTDATLLSLAHVAYRLGNENTDLGGETLANILAMLVDLDEFLTGNEVEEPLRTFLLDLVYQMKRAVRLARVSGVDGLEDIFESTVGAVVVRYGNEAPATTGDGQTAWSKLVAILSVIRDVVITTDAGVDLGLHSHGLIALGLRALGAS